MYRNGLTCAVADWSKITLSYLPVLTALVSIFSLFATWVIALDNRLDHLENRLFKVYSVVVSAQTTGSYCNVDIEKFLGPEESGD